jgi:ribosomal protein S25
MDKEQIINRLKEHWEYAVSLGYNEDRFLGIWLYGSQNYDLASETSDVDSKIIMLPTFEEFCLNKSEISKELHFDNGDHIEVKDIRLMREMFTKQNINYLEILFTDYFIVNPKYEKLWNSYFINNREEIAHFDRQKALKSISGQLLHTLKQDKTDYKKLYNSWRLYYFLRDYLAGKTYMECIVPKEEHDFLYAVKYGKHEICKNAETMLTSAAQVESLVNGLVDVYMGLDSPCHEAATAALNNGTIEILKSSFVEMQESTCSKEDFMKMLTNAETRAYYSIIREIGDEGNITISKLVERNSISRPVYNNLMTKLKEHNIASVVNMGMKGTYIKILHPELKAEAFDLY